MSDAQPAVWLTVHEVAEELRVDEETVRRWIRKAELLAMSLGSRKGGYRIRRADLDAFIQGRYDQSAKDQDQPGQQRAA